MTTFEVNQNKEYWARQAQIKRNQRDHGGVINSVMSQVNQNYRNVPRP